MDENLAQPGVSAAASAAGIRLEHCRLEQAGTRPGLERVRPAQALVGAGAGEAD
jgi:hypothetical protein